MLIRRRIRNMKFLKLKRDIEILEKQPESEEMITYRSCIKGIGEKSVFISPPFIWEDDWILLQAEVGKIFSAHIVTIQGAYSFEVELMKIHASARTLWEISLPMNITKIQRRQHVRLNINLDVTIEFIDTGKEKITVLTKDISAGGLQVIMEEVMPDGSNVNLLIQLTDESIVECKGEFVRTVPQKVSRDQFVTSIKFREIAKEEQEKITKYIFRKEVERRNKERALFGKSLTK